VHLIGLRRHHRDFRLLGGEARVSRRRGCVKAACTLQAARACADRRLAFVQGSRNPRPSSRRRDKRNIGLDIGLRVEVSVSCLRTGPWMGLGPSPRRNSTTSTHRSHRPVCTARAVPSRPIDDRGEPKESSSSSELLGVSRKPESGRAISPLVFRSQISSSSHQHPTDGKPRHHPPNEQRNPRSLRTPGESFPGFCSAGSSSLSDRVLVRERTTMLGRPTRQEEEWP